ncbi:MAG: hypothetical protein ACE5FZ_02635 [Nitrospiria bacterium]
MVLEDAGTRPETDVKNDTINRQFRAMLFVNKSGNSARIEVEYERAITDLADSYDVILTINNGVGTASGTVNISKAFKVVPVIYPCTPSFC